MDLMIQEKRDVLKKTTSRLPFLSRFLFDHMILMILGKQVTKYRKIS